MEANNQANTIFSGSIFSQQTSFTNPGLSPTQISDFQNRLTLGELDQKSLTSELVGLGYDSLTAGSVTSNLMGSI